MPLINQKLSIEHFFYLIWQISKGQNISQGHEHQKDQQLHANNDDKFAIGRAFQISEHPVIIPLSRSIDLTASSVDMVQDLVILMDHLTYGMRVVLHVPGVV